MEYIPLVQLCDFQGGSQPPKDQWINHEKEGYIRMLQIRDFTQPDKDNIEYVRISNTIKTCNADDVLIGRYGASVGKILTGLAGAYNVAIIKTIPDTSKLSKRFLYHYLNSPYFQSFILSVGSRAAQAGFNKDDLSDAQIPDLSLAAQNDVVVRLDKINELIALRKEQLAKLDQLVKSRFVELFEGKGFPQIPLGELVASKVSSVKKDFLPTDTIKYIDISSIDNKRNVMTGYTEYILEEAPSRAQQHIKKGDIVVSTVRPNLRNVAITGYDCDNLVASSGFCVLRAEKCLPSYLMAVVCSDDFTDAMTKVVTGANYPAIKDSDVRNYVVPNPPFELQKQFATFVEQTDKSKLAIQQSLDKLELLKKSLMQKYFG